jgi:hypothetical protein
MVSTATAPIRVCPHWRRSAWTISKKCCTLTVRVSARASKWPQCRRVTEADVDNVSAYYARQKARAVVFIALPAK